MKEVLKKLHNEINEIAPSARLMTVSKTYSYDAIEHAYELGERLFGENRVQEVESKFPKKEDRPGDMELHLIGHLQSNKVKKAVALVDSIDSVDSMKILKAIDKRAGEIGELMHVLLEFNTSGDENKSGFESSDDIKEALNESKNLDNIKVDGLMTIGPLGGREDEVKDAFSLLVEIKKKLENECEVVLTELSMGMSGDYKIALENGSTMIRVGTMIFGARDYSKKK
jgi:pyridoxal phosphate enzyme (YggS family)